MPRVHLCAPPGVIIGKKGSDIEKLKKQLAKMTSSEVSLNIVEIRKPEIDASSRRASPTSSSAASPSAAR